MGYEIELISKKFYIRVESVKSAWELSAAWTPMTSEKRSLLGLGGLPRSRQ